jgi:hypothetical protein
MSFLIFEIHFFLAKKEILIYRKIISWISILLSLGVTILRYVELRYISEISVEVRDPKISDGVNKYVSYSIKGIDRTGSFEV